MQPITIWRRISQFAFFVLTGEWLAVGWLRCPFGVPFVSCSSCSLTDCPGRYLLIPWFLVGIAASAIVFGRAFCGWVCPMGLVEDALGKLRKWRATIGERFARIDRVLKWLKYPGLVVVIYLIFHLNYQEARAYEYVTRTPSVFNLETISVAWGIDGGAYKSRLVLLGIALVGALIVTRLWCRYLCPFGALLSLFNYFSLLALRRDEGQCSDCGKYPRECPQHTVPQTPDCIVCGECAQGCPRGAVTFGVRGRAAHEAPAEAHDAEPGTVA